MVFIKADAETNFRERFSRNTEPVFIDVRTDRYNENTKSVSVVGKTLFR